MDVRVEQVIASPPERVAGYAMDWRHDAEWINGIHSAELSAEADGGGFGTGAEITRTSYILGRRIDYVFQVVDYAPPGRIELRAVAGPFPMDSTFQFAEHAGGTLASIHVRAAAGRYLRIGIPVLRTVVRSSLRRSLRALARNLG